jgi:hypothetical protein
VAVATREDPPSFDAITTIRSPAFHATEAVDFEPLLFQVVSVYETRVGAPVGTPEVIAPVAELTVDAVPATASVSVTAPDAALTLIAVPARSHVVGAAVDGEVSISSPRIALAAGWTKLIGCANPGGIPISSTVGSDTTTETPDFTTSVTAWLFCAVEPADGTTVPVLVPVAAFDERARLVAHTALSVAPACALPTWATSVIPAGGVNVVATFAVMGSPVPKKTSSRSSEPVGVTELATGELVAAD